VTAWPRCGEFRIQREELRAGGIVAKTEEEKNTFTDQKSPRAMSKNTTAILVAIIGVAGGWGTAYFSNYDKISRGQRLSEQAHIWADLREGHYQWQWGKEGWLGDISITKDAAGQSCVTVDLSKYCVHGGAPAGKVLVSRGCGETGHTSDGRPKLTIPVTHTLYDNKCSIIRDFSETLVIQLNPKEAYTGSVDYMEMSGKTSAGGISIVNWEYIPEK